MAWIQTDAGTWYNPTTGESTGMQAFAPADTSSYTPPATPTADSVQKWYDYYYGPGAYDAQVQRYQSLKASGQLGDYEKLYGAFPSDAAGIADWFSRAIQGGAAAREAEDQPGFMDSIAEKLNPLTGTLAVLGGGLAAGALGGAGAAGAADAGAGLAYGGGGGLEEFLLDPNATYWTDVAGTEAAGGAGSGAAAGTGGNLSLKDLATYGSLGASAATLADKLGGGGSQSDYYLDPANDPQATPEGQAASTAANSASGSGMTAEGFPTAGYDLSKADPGFLKWLADSLGTTPENLGKIAGALLPAALGAYGASQQSDALKNLAAQQDARWREMMSLGAPYRSKLSDLYANPAGYLSSPEVQVPVQQGTDALARSLSAKVGNPISNPTALSELQDYSANQLYGRLGQEKDRLAGFGGLSAYNAAGASGSQNSLQAQLGAIQSGGNIFNAVGSGLANYFNPPITLESLLKTMQGSNIFTTK